MTFVEFINKYCCACGGDWTFMLLDGIKRWNRELWDSLPDKEYSWGEVCDILIANGIDCSKDANKKIG